MKSMTLNNFVTITKTESKIGVRTDCYYSVLQQYQKKYPHAYFEIVMRFPFDKTKQPSVIAPSKYLLGKFKTHKMTFPQFSHDFEAEIFMCKNSVNKLKILQDIATRKTVFLVCCEKSPVECHRSLLKQYIENLEDYLETWGKN